MNRTRVLIGAFCLSVIASVGLATQASAGTSPTQSPTDSPTLHGNPPVFKNCTTDPTPVTFKGNDSVPGQITITVNGCMKGTDGLVNFSIYQVDDGVTCDSKDFNHPTGNCQPQHSIQNEVFGDRFHSGNPTDLRLDKYYNNFRETFIIPTCKAIQWDFYHGDTISKVGPQGHDGVWITGDIVLATGTCQTVTPVPPVKPVVPVAPVPPAPITPQSLPFTGSTTDTMIEIGLGLVMAGLVISLGIGMIGRYRRQH